MDPEEAVPVPVKFVALPLQTAEAEIEAVTCET